MSSLHSPKPGLLPLGLKLSEPELLILQCFKDPERGILYPDVQLTTKEVMLALNVLKSKQLLIKRQYLQLTKKGREVWLLLYGNPRQEQLPSQVIRE